MRHSPRAAWRPEGIGFARVHDYVAGKADWGSFGLPLEGQRYSGTRVGALLHTEVPACTLEESLRHVCGRVRAAGWDTCLVVNEQLIVLGRLGRAALGRHDDVTVEQAMTAAAGHLTPQPRPDRRIERMGKQNLTNLPVTLRRCPARTHPPRRCRAGAPQLATTRRSRAACNVFSRHRPNRRRAVGARWRWELLAAQASVTAGP